MERKLINNQTQLVTIPVTEHALKRQAKRIKKGLEFFAANPPAKITLALAQEFLAQHVWGQGAWSLLAPVAEPGLDKHLHNTASACHPPVAPGMTLARSVKKDAGPILGRIGCARAQTLVSLFVDRSNEDMWVARAIELGNLLVELEYARVNVLSDARFREIYHASFGDPGQPFPATPPVAFSVASFNLLMNLDYLEWYVWTLPTVRISRSEGVIDVSDPSYKAFAEAQDYLRVFPTYLMDRVGKPRGQTEDTRHQFSFLTGILRSAFYLIGQIEAANPIFWDKKIQFFIGDILENWHLSRESWLGAPNPESYDNPDLGSLSHRSKVTGGEFDAIDALALLSYGAQSNLSQYLLSWVRRPHLAKELSDQLQHYTNQRFKEELSTPRDSARWVVNNCLKHLSKSNRAISHDDFVRLASAATNTADISGHRLSDILSEIPERALTLQGVPVELDLLNSCLAK